MTDLEWLARRVREWGGGDETKAHRTMSGQIIYGVGCPDGCGVTKEQWQAERKRLGLDTSAHVNTSGGMKFDDDKPRFDLIPPTAERMLADVLTFGARKYAPDNWRKVDDAETRYIAAALRHINAHRSGEQHDTETGLPHLAHAMCCLAFVIELEELEARQ